VQAGSFLFGDVDNDGDEDVFAALDVPLPGDANVLLLNDGQGHFTVKASSGVEGQAGNTVAGSAAFGDFNSDGKLDLYIANGQTSYDAADQLFFGNGDGTFTEVTAKSLPGNPAVPHNGVVACDYDNDGDLDIFVSTYGVSENNGHKILWENDGKGAFQDVALARGFAAQATGNYWLASTGHGTLTEPDAGPTTYDGSNGFGIDCDDIDGDGVDDILLATISHPSTRTRAASGPIRRSCSSTRAQPEATPSRTNSSSAAFPSTRATSTPGSPTSTTTGGSTTRSRGTTSTSPTTRRPSSSRGSVSFTRRRAVSSRASVSSAASTTRTSPTRGTRPPPSRA